MEWWERLPRVLWPPRWGPKLRDSGKPPTHEPILEGAVTPSILKEMSSEFIKDEHKADIHR